MTAPDKGGRWRVVENERPVDMRARLSHDVQVGLLDSPPWLPARWFYDETGGLLFDDITGLPEYYPTRRETEILTAHSRDIVGLSGATTLVELGSGTSTKTRLLLDALTAGGRPLRRSSLSPARRPEDSRRPTPPRPTTPRRSMRRRATCRWPR